MTALLVAAEEAWSGASAAHRTLCTRMPVRVEGEVASNLAAFSAHGDGVRTSRPRTSPRLSLSSA